MDWLVAPFSLSGADSCGRHQTSASATRTCVTTANHRCARAIIANTPTITASTTDFLLNTSDASGTGTDNFILQINGFSDNGTPISVPGPGTSYGLYIEGTVSVHGSPSVYIPGTIALVLDPTDNDGTPAATWDPTTQSGSVGFSNLANTADDIVLATGNFISGSFGTQSNGQPGVNFLETFKLNPAVFGPFLSRLSSSLDLEETLFNRTIPGTTISSRMTGATNNGGSRVTVNEGDGVVQLTPDWAGLQGSPSGGAPAGLYDPETSGGWMQALLSHDHHPG